MPRLQQKAQINVDLGEGYGNYTIGPDEDLLPYIDHANVACYFHAGDPVIMGRTVKLCKKYGVKIGAHTGLPDIHGFGRRQMKLTSEEHTANTMYQVGALKAFCDREGVALHHVKPHGILYEMISKDIEVARAVYAGIPKDVPVFGQAGTCGEQAARELGLPFFAEYFGDVRYDNKGFTTLERKRKPWTEEEVKAHVRGQLESLEVTAVTGERVKIQEPNKDYPITICCHSDSPDCMMIIKATREVADEFNKTYGF